MGFVQYDFLSEKLGYHTNLYLILPDCMGAGERPAATLYLLHGGGGNGLDWMRFSSIERYAQERKLAVVMPEVDGSCFYADMKYGYPYFTYLTEEVPRVAETLFSVNNRAQERLVAGFSMGGYGAFKWAFLRPEFFAAAANLSGFSFIMDVFSPEGFGGNSLEGQEKIVRCDWGSLEELKGSDSDSETWIKRAVENKIQLPALFAGIGTEDFSYPYGKKYLEYCEKCGVKIHYEEMPGAHEWKVWDEMIVWFLDWRK